LRLKRDTAAEAWQEVPKALIPVGNKPLLSYPLDALQAAGFHDVIVVSSLSLSLSLGHGLSCPRRLNAAGGACCTSRWTRLRGRGCAVCGG
jgi:hypothetical protein